MIPALSSHTLELCPSINPSLLYLLKQRPYFVLDSPTMPTLVVPVAVVIVIEEVVFVEDVVRLDEEDNIAVEDVVIVAVEVVIVAVDVVEVYVVYVKDRIVE